MVEPFAALLGLSALCTVLANTWPCQPARHHSTTVHKACPYMDMLPIRWLRDGSILNEDELASPLFLSVCYLSMPQINKKKLPNGRRTNKTAGCVGARRFVPASCTADTSPGGCCWLSSAGGQPTGDNCLFFRRLSLNQCCVGYI